MQLSRPAAVMAFMAALVAAAAWYAPPQELERQVSVMLPKSTYDRLVAEGRSRPTADGRSRSAAEVIEMLAGQ